MAILKLNSVFLYLCFLGVVWVRVVWSKSLVDPKVANAPRGYSWNMMLPRSSFYHTVPVPKGRSTSLDNKSPVNTGNGINHGKDKDSRDPSFIPFISARALSNLRGFFDHLQENLIAMKVKDFLPAQKTSKVHVLHGTSAFTGSMGLDKPLPRGMYGWSGAHPIPNNRMPPTMSQGGGDNPKHEPHLLQNYMSLFESTNELYHPHWKVTNLGLGRRKK